MTTEFSTNPFATLLAGLSETEAVHVTYPLLQWIKETINEPNEIIQTYDEAFKVLQFLNTAGVIELSLVNQVFTVRKL